MRNAIVTCMVIALPVLIYAGVVHGQTRFVATYGAVSTGNCVNTHMVVHQTTGDISLCGYYSGSSAFGGKDLNSGGEASQAFLMRLNSAGAVKWIREIQGTGVQRAFGTAVDGSGNSYVIGESTGSAVIQGGANDAMALAQGGTYMFVAKYSADGDLLWARTGVCVDENSIGEVSGSAVTVDTSGNVYATGWFMDSVSFGEEPEKQYSGSIFPTNIFVTKYDATGEVEWVRAVTDSDRCRIHGVAAAGAESVTIAGEFSGTASFDVNHTITSSGDSDVFIARYSAAGAVQWARKAGGAGADSAYGLAMDSTGTTVVSGRIARGAADFGEGVEVAGSGDGSGFVARYDSLGTPSWAVVLGGAGGSEARGVSLGQSGIIAVTGAFSGEVVFPGKYLVSRGGTDVIVAFYEPTGAFVSAISAGGESDDDSGRAAAWQDALLVVTGNRGTNLEPEGGVLFLTFVGDVSPDGTIPGDYNLDGHVDLNDVIGMLQMIIRSGIAAEGAIAGDVTGDGYVGLEDVIAVLQKVALLR